MTDPLDLSPAEQEMLERFRFDPDRPGLVRPSYDGYGIVNLPWTVLDALGVPVEGPPLAPGLIPADLLAGVQSVLLIVVDALGYGQLRRAMTAGDAPALAVLAQRHPFFPLTSTFPSTTVAALTAIQTGEPPSRHGLVGYTCYLREYGMLSNLIRFAPVGRFESYAAFGVDPRAFLPVPTIYDRAAQAGVAVSMVNFRPFQKTPLTRIHSTGVPYSGYSTLGEFGTMTRRSLAEPGRRLVLAYWPMVDLIGHQYGPDDETSTAEIRLLDALLERMLLDRLPRDDILVILTADHGQVPLDPSQVVDLAAEAELLQELRIPPAGERRAGYFYPRPGREDEVAARLAEIVGERGWIESGADLLARGLFGPEPFYAEVPYRVGDVVLLARGSASFPYRVPGDASGPMLGAHGSLEADEMLVPCLVWRPE